jgi:hypothetical protein
MWARQSKYGAIKTEVDGIVFHSKGEAGRYQELKLLLHAGEITDLHLQEKYELKVAGVLICNYIADFVYETPDGEVVVEDFKGVRTEAYRLKKKLMLAVHGIEIFETGRTTKRGGRKKT